MWTVYQKVDNHWFRIGVNVGDLHTAWKDHVFLLEIDNSLELCINRV